MIYDPLEFEVIRQQLSELALSNGAKAKINALTASVDEGQVKSGLDDTTAAKELIECFGTPPLAVMRQIREAVELAAKGAMLSPEQLSDIAQFLNTCDKMYRYLRQGESLGNHIAYLGNSLVDLEFLKEAINTAIRNGEIDDRASSALRDIRRKIQLTSEKIKEKLNGLLRGNKNWFADSFITTRNGRMTLPLKKEYKSKLPGLVVDISQSGGTLFVEPEQISKLQNDMYGLQLDEDNECRRILYELSGLTADKEREISLNREAMETLDFVFAKAKLSIQMRANPININTSARLSVKEARHPLIKYSEAVPLSIDMGGSLQGIIITGPNTGGKTVALKTVGLLCMMVQSGLHVPADSNSDFCLRDAVLCDVGDGQSISENLSTFSAHMSKIIKILEEASPDSLVLLDELGSGTDPAEGMGLAAAILEELKRKGPLIICTTHYPEIKELAEKTEGFINGRMAFDKESLTPLYRLEVGEAGESCALFIAKRLGFSEHIINRAYEVAYGIKSGGAEITSGPVKPSLIKRQEKKALPQRAARFNLGDCVIVYPNREIGIVYKKADENGMVGVQIKKRKNLIQHKRLKLHIAADEMYPDDYDFSIIFDTVANRKARHAMDKGHTGISITLEE